MKKILLKTGIGFVVLLVIAILAVSLFLDGIVKRGVETIGPKLTKVDIKLSAVSLSLLSGSGNIKGLEVGNPEGYKTPQAISVGDASFALKPGSLLSDKIVIKSLVLEMTEVTFEAGPGGNNLSKILANLNATSGENEKGTASAPKVEKPGKKFEVDDLQINGATLHLSMTGLKGNAVPIPLPPIHLTDLGTGSDGITAAELTKRVLEAIIASAEKAAASGITDLGKGATDAAKSIGKTATDGVGKIGKSLGDLFKTK
jgi:uncharacterized protein involved in outer membrane biogenesis